MSSISPVDSVQHWHSLRNMGELCEEVERITSSLTCVFGGWTLRDCDGADVFRHIADDWNEGVMTLSSPAVLSTVAGRRLRPVVRCIRIGVD